MMIDRRERINMFCVKCGARLPDGSAFCSKCGARLGAGGINNGVSNTPSPGATGQPRPVRRLGETAQSGTGAARGEGRRTAGAIGSRAAATQAASRPAGSVLGKLGGLGAKKLLIAAAAVVGVAAVAGNMDKLVGADKGNISTEGRVTSEKNTGSGGNQNKTGNSSGNTDFWGTAKAEGATITIDKDSYDPGETITVSYRDVTDNLVKQGAWLGLAGAQKPASEFSDQVSLSKGSGEITMYAPQSPGAYEVRLYTLSEATDASLSVWQNFSVGMDQTVTESFFGTWEVVEENTKDGSTFHYEETITITESDVKDRYIVQSLHPYTGRKDDGWMAVLDGFYNPTDASLEFAILRYDTGLPPVAYHRGDPGFDTGVLWHNDVAYSSLGANTVTLSAKEDKATGELVVTFYGERETEDGSITISGTKVSDAVRDLKSEAKDYVFRKEERGLTEQEIEEMLQYYEYLKKHPEGKAFMESAEKTMDHYGIEY